MRRSMADAQFYFHEVAYGCFMDPKKLSKANSKVYSYLKTKQIKQITQGPSESEPDEFVNKKLQQLEACKVKCSLLGLDSRT